MFQITSNTTKAEIIFANKTTFIKPYQTQTNGAWLSFLFWLSYGIMQTKIISTVVTGVEKSINHCALV